MTLRPRLPLGCAQGPPRARRCCQKLLLHAPWRAGDQAAAAAGAWLQAGEAVTQQVGAPMYRLLVLLLPHSLTSR